MKILIPDLPDEIAEECLIRVAYDHLPLLRSVCRQWRELVLSPDFHSRRRLAGSTRPLLAVIHSVPKFYLDFHIHEPQHSLTIFDPIPGTHRSLPFVPGLPNLSQVQIVGVGHLLLVFGRHQPSSVSIYCWLTGTWREGTPMPGEERSNFTCVSDGDKHVYVAGGYVCRVGNSLPSVMRYNVEENKWDTLPDLAKGGLFSQGAFHAGKLYLIRKQWDGEDYILAKYIMEVYDVLSRSWSIVELMDCLNLKYWVEESCEFAFASDGKIYSRWKGGNLKVKEKEKEEWEEFVDLPDDSGLGFSYLGSWKEGVFIIGFTTYGPIPWRPALYNAYTLMLGDQNQNLTWERHVMLLKGSISHVFWLEI